MFGEAFAIVHLVLIEVEDIAYDFLYDFCPRRFRLVLVLFLELLALRFGRPYQGVFAKVGFLELMDGTLAFTFLTCLFVAVAYHAVSLDGLLSEDFTLRTIDKITFGIPYEVSFKSLGMHLFGSHLQYGRICNIGSEFLDLCSLCIG